MRLLEIYKSSENVRELTLVKCSLCCCQEGGPLVRIYYSMQLDVDRGRWKCFVGGVDSVGAVKGRRVSPSD